MQKEIRLKSWPEVKGFVLVGNCGGRSAQEKWLDNGQATSWFWETPAISASKYSDNHTFSKTTQLILIPNPINRLVCWSICHSSYNSTIIQHHSSDILKLTVIHKEEKILGRMSGKTSLLLGALPLLLLVAAILHQAAGGVGMKSSFLLY